MVDGAREAVSTAGAPAAIGPYAQAVRCEGWLFCSGQIALRPDGTFVAGDVQVETRQALENLRAVLESGGASLARVVKTTVYLTTMDDFPAMNEVYAEFFGAAPPARATVAVAGLPRGARVEVDAVAACG